MSGGVKIREQISVWLEGSRGDLSQPNRCSGYISVLIRWRETEETARSVLVPSGRQVKSMKEVMVVFARKKKSERLRLRRRGLEKGQARECFETPGRGGYGRRIRRRRVKKVERSRALDEARVANKSEEDGGEGGV